MGIRGCLGWVYGRQQEHHHLPRQAISSLTALHQMKRVWIQTVLSLMRSLKLQGRGKRCAGCRKRATTFRYYCVVVHGYCHRRGFRDLVLLTAPLVFEGVSSLSRRSGRLQRPDATLEEVSPLQTMSISFNSRRWDLTPTITSCMSR